MPVELLSFEGKNIEGGNFLTWTTANEVNNKGFQVERRQAATDTWDAIGFVAANNKASNYQFLDDHRRDAINRVSTATATTEYYRLRQIDNDGKETLSKVVSIQAKGNNKLSVYPNPVSNTLTIETEVNGDYQIFNLLGQVVLRGQTSPVGVAGLDVSALPKGSYILKMGNEQAQFIKQ